MDDPAWLLLTIIRMILPIVILKRPLLGVFVCMGVDFMDFSLLPLHTPSDYKMYQIWDKSLDTYYLAFAAYIAYFWKDKMVARLAVLAFAYRVIGVLLLIVTEEKFILLLFPNFFEGLFVFYLVFKSIEKREKLFNSIEDFAIIFSAILIPKLFQEFYLHTYAGPRPFFLGAEIRIHISQDISVDMLPVILYVSLPLLAMTWRLRKHIPSAVHKLHMSLEKTSARYPYGLRIGTKIKILFSGQSID